MVKLDKTEREIIKLLQEDGRMSFVDMAQAIGVTEGTVRRKYYRLVEQGIVRIGASSDPFLIGFSTPAVIGLNVETKKLKDVAKQLAELPRVRQVVLSTGIFDLILFGYFASNQELAQFITEELAQVDGIIDTNTLVVVEMLKDSFKVGLPDEPFNANKDA